MKTFIDWLTEKENEDDLPFELNKEEVITWVKSIQDSLISDGKKPWDGRHYGDCTKQNVSCQICMYQTWLDDYEKYCRNLINY